VPFGGKAGQGLFAIPDKGAGVWVEFEEGDLEFPVWVGTFWSKPGGTSEVPVTRDRDGKEGGVSDPPTRRIFTTTTTGGRTIQIEDADGHEMILIHDAKNEHTIVLDGKGVMLAHHDGHKIEMTEGGVTITSKTDFTLDVTGAVTIKGATVDFKKQV
jgi:uncharacterized protein involved in type VI secretion and phage assembly